MDNNVNNTYETTTQYEPQQVPQPVPNAYQPQLEEPVTMGDWVATLLLFSLVPCIGLILCIVWAFSKDTKKSKANFCKAYLIITLISIILAVVMFLLFGGLIAAATAGSGCFY